MFEKNDLIDEKYRVIEKLGEGGFGIVYKCKDIDDENFKAVKICKAKKKKNIKRFEREVRLAEKIDQKNVIELLQTNLSYKPMYFVMPLAKCNLKNYLKNNELSEEEIINIFIEVCQGINSLHLSEEVHRDINPNNILMMSNDRVVITDLGLGKFEERDSTVLTDTYVMMGTEGYIPPEFRRPGGTKEADKKSDIYQLGKTLYYLLTQKHPYYIEKDLLNTELEYIVNKATKTDPDNRYKSVNELVDSLNNYLLSLNPDNNPVISIDGEIKSLEESLNTGAYDKVNLENILRYLRSLKSDNSTFLEQFDRIPEESYRIYIEELFDEFKDILEIYNTALENFFHENMYYSFSYAETVARKMEKIYFSTQDFELKANVLNSILIASVMCNRWAAMESFDEILLSINKDEEGYIISEMLRENKDYYSRLYSRIDKHKLNSRIQVIWEQVDSEE